MGQPPKKETPIPCITHILVPRKILSHKIRSSGSVLVTQLRQQSPTGQILRKWNPVMQLPRDQAFQMFENYNATYGLLKIFLVLFQKGFCPQYVAWYFRIIIMINLILINIMETLLCNCLKNEPSFDDKLQWCA